MEEQTPPKKDLASIYQDVFASMVKKNDDFKRLLDEIPKSLPNRVHFFLLTQDAIKLTSQLATLASAMCITSQTGKWHPNEAIEVISGQLAELQENINSAIEKG